MFPYEPGRGIVAMFLEAPDPLTRLAERPMPVDAAGVVVELYQEAGPHTCSTPSASLVQRDPRYRRP